MEQSEQLSIFNLDIPQSEPSEDAAAKDLFSCCHLYRECSDARKCIAGEKTNSAACAYRKNLENGKIFYGKNAVGFDVNIYKSLTDTYKSLDISARETLNNLIFYFLDRPGVGELMYYNIDFQKLKDVGFIELSKPRNLLLELYKQTALKKFLDENSPPLKKKSEIADYLLDNPTTLFDETVEKFAYVSFPIDKTKYITELYYDFLSAKRAEYKPPLLPVNAEKDFVKTKG